MTLGPDCRGMRLTPPGLRWFAKRIIETAQRPGIDVQKLRDDAIAYVKNNPLWPTP